MRRDDLMKPDLLSGILLVSSGIALALALLMVVVTAFARIGMLR